MIDLTSAPSSRLKTLTFFARWSLWLLVLVWGLFLVAWGGLHWLIVPRIGDFRPQLEAKATQVLGVPVRIGSITAHSHGMIPSFEISQLQLFDAQGREALRLPKVLAALSPRSVWNLGFDQLYIDSPQLNVRRAADGKIYVAGLDFSQKNDDSDSSAVDWFFSQIEFVIHDGTIEWTDELNARPTLALQQVDLVVRNRARHHDMRLDATPPAAWGERFSVRAKFVQPLLSRGSSRWRAWEGQIFGDFNRVDLSELQMLPRGFEFEAQALAFDTHDGLHWHAGNISALYLSADADESARGEFKADKLDLATLSQIADRLPIDPKMRATLAAYAPKGLVQRIQARWQGPFDALNTYEARGRVSGLAFSAQNARPVAGAAPKLPLAVPESLPGAGLDAGSDSPGIRGVNAEFELNQSGGKASVQVVDGAVDLPGVFDDPLVAVNRLSGEVKWQVKGEHIALQLPNLKFSNDDAQGEAQIKWETSDPAQSEGRSRFPGVLDLQAVLSRADGTRVYRYLPTVLSQSVRDYVRDAFPVGKASGVKFRVRGDLYDMPFKDPKKGEFRISADIHNATFLYVPSRIQSPGEQPWPALTQLSGELVIERTQLQVRSARAKFGSTSGLQVTRVDANIPDMDQSIVSVTADVRGPLPEVLGIVNGSPLAAMTEHALAQTVATGLADYKFKLNLPLDNMDASTVQGSVMLAGNDVQISPSTPKLLRARGPINFTDSGFSLAGVQARMLGGDVRLDGGWLAEPVVAKGPVAARAPAAMVIRASGTASADGLRQATELGFVARLAQNASGSAAYTAVLGFRRGEPELQVFSNLQGLSLGLPAQDGQVRLRDQFTLELGRMASIVYQRDLSGALPRVVRGSIAVGLAGDEAVPLPDEGVVANINMSGVNLDAWSAALTQAAGTSLAGAAPAPAGR